jgi:serine/threonine protein kinase
MEFIAGEAILAWAQRKDKGERLETFVKMLGIVEKTVHENGIVHGDLTIGNWMVQKDSGKIVLIDFGIAKNLSSRANLTTAGSYLGTETYTDEVMRKDAGMRDYRSDIFTMAVSLWVLYHGLEPEPVFDKKHSADINKTYPADHLPASIEAIYRKATEQNISKRYQDISEFREDFEKILPEFLAPKPAQKKEIIGFVRASAILDKIWPGENRDKAFAKLIWRAVDLREKISQLEESDIDFEEKKSE